MSLIFCPDCGKSISDRAPACPECGRPMDPANPEPPPPPLFPVATHKFIVMSLCTFGIYDRYWAYKQWEIIRNETGESLSPFWRAFFSPFWGFSLLSRIDGRLARSHMRAGWNSSLLGLLYFVLSISYRLPDPWWLVSLLAFVPLVIVQGSVQQLVRQEAPGADLNSRFSAWNIVGIVFGGLVLFLAVLGTLAPDPAAEFDAVQRG